MIEIEARLYRDKSKNPMKYQFVQLDVNEAKHLNCGSIVQFVMSEGAVACAKVTSVKTWKTRPLDCDVHLKYGLYLYFIASYRDGVSDNLIKIVKLI